ncbi:hypothetical protein PRSY57_0401900, partial [Plasmodium reichenowi]
MKSDVSKTKETDSKIANSKKRNIEKITSPTKIPKTELDSLNQNENTI